MLATSLPNIDYSTGLLPNGSYRRVCASIYYAFNNNESSSCLVLCLTGLYVSRITVPPVCPTPICGISKEVDLSRVICVDNILLCAF